LACSLLQFVNIIVR